MKYKVHVFEEVRQSYIVEAESKEAAVRLVIGSVDSLRTTESEFTGDYSDDVCVDPMNEDGTADLDNYEWFNLKKLETK